MKIIIRETVQENPLRINSQISLSFILFYFILFLYHSKMMNYYDNWNFQLFIVLKKETLDIKLLKSITFFLSIAVH